MVSVPHIVPPQGTLHLSAVLHLLLMKEMVVMTSEDLAARVVNILIGIGTETGHGPGIGIVTVKGTGIVTKIGAGTGIVTVKGKGNVTVIGTDIVTEIGAGTGIESETAKDTGTGIEIMRGTESGGIRSAKERESGVMIMIGGLGTQRETAVGIMIMAVGVIVVGAGVEVEVGAGVEVRACKLALCGLTHVLVLREMEVRRLLHPVI